MPPSVPTLFLRAPGDGRGGCRRKGQLWRKGRWEAAQDKLPHFEDLPKETAGLERLEADPQPPGSSLPLLLGGWGGKKASPRTLAHRVHSSLGACRWDLTLRA